MEGGWAGMTTERGALPGGILGQKEGTRGQLALMGSGPQTVRSLPSTPTS